MNHFFSTALLASALVIGILCAPLAASSANAAGIMPLSAAGQLLQDSGRIDTVEFQHDAILIDDRGFTLTQDVPVHGGGASNRNALRVGAQIRFSYYYNGPRPVITEVWLTTRQ